MFSFHRRDFPKHAAAGSLASRFVISGTKASGRVRGANDRVETREIRTPFAVTDSTPYRERAYSCQFPHSTLGSGRLLAG